MDETNWSVLINDVHSTIEPQSLKTKPNYFTFHTFDMQVFYKKIVLDDLWHWRSISIY